jgi:hypothetical protein
MASGSEPSAPDSAADGQVTLHATGRVLLVLSDRHDVLTFSDSRDGMRCLTEREPPDAIIPKSWPTSWRGHQGAFWKSPSIART